MRDLLVFGFVVLLLPTCFRRPFIGLLLFSWLAYMRPQNLCWGFARSMRFSFYVAITMLIGWYVYESHTRRFFVREVRSYLLTALAVGRAREGIDILIEGMRNPPPSKIFCPGASFWGPMLYIS